MASSKALLLIVVIDIVTAVYLNFIKNIVVDTRQYCTGVY